MQTSITFLHIMCYTYFVICVIRIIASRSMVKYDIKARKYVAFQTYKTEYNLIKVQQTKIFNYDYM